MSRSKCKSSCRIAVNNDTYDMGPGKCLSLSYVERCVPMRSNVDPARQPTISVLLLELQMRPSSMICGV